MLSYIISHDKSSLLLMLIDNNEHATTWGDNCAPQLAPLPGTNQHPVTLKRTVGKPLIRSAILEGQVHD